MTKPSYEEAELKKLAETVLDKYRLDKESNCSRPDQIDAAETRFYAAATPHTILQLLTDLEAATSNMETYEAENLRVRGLLQRIVSAHTLYNNRLTSETMAILADTIREAAEFSLSQPNDLSLVTKVVMPTPVDTSALLSRAAGFVRACAEEGMFDTAYQEKAAECLAQIEANFPQSSSPVSQGAESREFGKENTVDDEHRIQGKVIHCKPLGAESADIGKLDG